MAARGRHTVFIGMAPGVGKTYQMLEEGREEQARGRDVMIGYLESHGRADTLAQAAGIPTLPRRRIEYHGVTLEEMDLQAILRRRPQLCLIDELAHTNVPGVEHRKRYEDVVAVMKEGIDVYSTVNVQHLESLAGQVAALTGVQVRETLPDRVLDEAHDVVLVDITPDLLVERLEGGKIYSDQAAATALSNFFRPDKLAALREMALLETVEEIEPEHGSKSSPALPSRKQSARSGDHVLALATPDPWTRPVVYHAYRVAQGLGASLDVLWVRAGPEQTLSGRAADELEALERLASTLGGTLLVRHGRDLVETTAKLALERGATHIVIGRPRHRRLGLLAHRQLPVQLMDALPRVDMQLVALGDSARASPRNGR